ncbi:MAG: MMPL family transporter, partial [Planctomycetota bacterium]
TGLQIDTHLLSLLPDTERDPVLEEVGRLVSTRAGRTTLFLIGHEDPAQAATAARLFGAELAQGDGFEQVIAEFGPDRERAVYDLYFPYRYQLARGEPLELLADGQPATALIERTAAQLYGPASGMMTPIVEEDPLLLFPSFLAGLAPPGDDKSVVDGVPTVQEDGGLTFGLVTAQLAGDPFSERAQEQVARDVERARTTLEPLGARLLWTGLPRFASAVREGITGEIATIGVGSMLGVLLLLIVTFRGVRPLLVGVLPILAGLTAALAVSLVAFGRLHAFTLAFGASLIGVAIDYAFHYLAHYRVASERWDAHVALRTILPGITLGMVTTALGYLGLLLAPFPGLRQMATFATVGVATAYLTVCLWYPWLLRAPPGYRRPSWLHGLASRVLARDSSRARLAATLLLGVAAMGTSAVFLKVDDDVRRLQRVPAWPTAEDERVRDLVGGVDSSRLVLIVCKDEAEVLERQEIAHARLLPLIETGSLRTFQSLAPFVPSPGTQRAAYEQLRESLRADEAAIKRDLDTLGFEPAVAQGAFTAVAAPAPRRLLTLSEFLASPTGDLAGRLWLGPTRRGVSSAILLGRARDLAPVREALREIPGVKVVDRLAEITSLFSRYRKQATALVLAAYLVIALVILTRYGLRRGAVVLLPPVVTAACALALLSLIGEPLHIMHLLALLLVLGMGVDYAVFFAEARSEKSEPIVFFALALSAITTTLAFGLLALSQTPALRAIGIVVGPGIVLSLLLAPVARRSRTSASSSP